MCDRVSFIGYNGSQYFSGKEMLDNIEWEDDSKQWNAKSKIQLRYRKDIQRKKMRETKKQMIDN